MRFAGLNFSKINIEKKENMTKDIKVDTKINVSDIKKTDVKDIQIKEDFIVAKFSYNIDYKPDFAKIIFEGDVLFTMNSKESKKILDEWKKNKIEKDFQFLLFNIIIRKSNLKALQLEEDLNIPLHIPFPSIQKKGKED